MRTGVVTATAAMLLGAASAWAAPVFIGEFTVTDGPGTGGGGEFFATQTLTNTFANLGQVGRENIFETFCLQTDENIQLNTLVKVDQNDVTVLGGKSLDNKAAWMYKQFITGALVGYNSVTMLNTTSYDYDPALGGGRIDDATWLQRAMWAAQGENAIPALGTRGREFYDAAAKAVADGYTNDGSVVILNLYTQQQGGARVEIQDVIGLVTVIPLPTSAAAGLAMIGGLAFVRRRRA